MKKFAYTDMLAYIGINSAHPGGSSLTKDILATEKITPEMHVLDIGCGTGHTAALLAKKFKCNVTAVDAHSLMVEKAKKRFERENLTINVIKGHLEQLALKNESFDYIFAESVIVFTSIEYFLPEINRILKQEGKLIAIEMVTEEPLTSKEKTEIESFYGIKKILSSEEWQTTFLNYGFSKILIEDYQISNENDTITEKHLPSHFIDPELFKILERHSELLQKYKNKLGFRIFRCFK